MRDRWRLVDSWCGERARRGLLVFQRSSMEGLAVGYAGTRPFFDGAGFFDFSDLSGYFDGKQADQFFAELVECGRQVGNRCGGIDPLFEKCARALL